MKKFPFLRCVLIACSLLGAGALANSARAGQVTYNFDTDPYAVLQILGNNPTPWQPTGGNPAGGGFLALTYATTYQNTHIIFPDLDPGKVVTAFTFSCDLRIGNSTGDRAADGFSINFARAGDPVLTLAETDPGRGFAGDTMSGFGGGENASLPETGTITGIAVSFDTWAGNPLPDGSDIEGIIVRVDNKTVLRQALPTRHGACDDATSLQTGPRDAAYWSGGGDPYAPQAWQGLCWQPFSVELDNNAKLSVSWKGKTILDHFQTDYFPTAGRLVFAGRTGGSNENTDVDNIKLTTIASSDASPPTAPTNLSGSSVGARRVLLTWGASTDDSNRVNYHVERDGVRLTSLQSSTSYEDLNTKPGTSYSYRVRAVDPAQNTSAWVTTTITTVAEVDSPAFLTAEIYDSIANTDVASLLADKKYPNGSDRGRYLNGLSFGDPAFGDTYGDNLGVRITGVLTAPETAQYDFFVRSDDASQFFLNTSGAAIPDPLKSTPIAQEQGCCNAFQEPGATQTTAKPISLQAGQKYGFVFLVKEGGGGDWGQVAMRKVGDTTPASQLQPIRGIVSGKSDPVGASVSFTQQPQNLTVIANEKVTLSATAQGTSPYTTSVVYQWYKNGNPLLGANATTYSIAAVPQSDNGAKFKVVAAVPGASATSSEVTLTVNTDTKPPSLVSVTGSDSFTQATVKFSEPVTTPSATTAANYAFSGGVTVTSAQLVDPFTVALTTSKQAASTAYTITVNNVKDISGNSVAAGTQIKLDSWVLASKRVKMERYTGISGTAVADLLADKKYPNSPDAVEYLPGLTFGQSSNFGDTYGDNFGARITGWLIPTVTGDYNFFVRSDDASALYLSTNDTFPDPNVDLAIAEETDCCDAFSETTAGDPATTAAPIHLVAGQKYGVVYLVKEGGGGDWGQVAMRRVGVTTAAANLPPISDEMWFWAPPGTQDVTRPGDKIVATSSNSPAAEGVANAIDDSSSTKYLNFDKLNTGFTVTPAAGATTVTGIALTSANDAQPRDPASYKLEGSLDGSTFTLISEGTVAAFPTRFMRQEISFPNTAAYTSYRVTFPTVANETSANSMQIAEVELIGKVGGSVAPRLSVTLNAGQVSITWSGGKLQQAAAVNGPWTDVSNAASPYSVTPAGTKFFRTSGN